MRAENFPMADYLQGNYVQKLALLRINYSRGPAKVRNTVLKPAFHAGQNGPKVTSAGPLVIPVSTF
jgi:hypothetical protein